MAHEREVLAYHSTPRPGKTEVVPTKPCLTQSDLAIAYSPGVAIPCEKIKAEPDLSFEYTNRGNLIAVISNGSAVLGLGNIGPLAGKPVMEGKAVLFKRFAGIDVFDIEVDASDPDQFIQTVAALEPTFGGINLEDIKAPDCFYIEEQLIKKMSIPVFHDDQHGTAIISAAALLNACELTQKKIEDIKIVINGAGAAGIACAKMYISVGARKENILLLDTKGVIYAGRGRGMNPYKEEFARETDLRTLDDAASGADVLVGLSVKGAFSPAMVKSMNRDPVIFALANPDPEIGYYEAKEVRPDAIVATGRSDFPNQVNNVLGFPFVFRGALDVRATQINEAMKVAAVKALAKLAKEDVTDAVVRAYGGKPIFFGTDYIIPKPLDSRVLLEVTPAVAAAAIQSGVARRPISDAAAYTKQLEASLGKEREILRDLITSAQQDPKRLVFAEGEEPVILRAAHQLIREGIAKPLLLGNQDVIAAVAKAHHVSLDGIEIIDHVQSPLRESYAQALFEIRKRKGWSREECDRQLRDPYLFGAMMVRSGAVDGQVHGVNPPYPDAIRPVLRVIPRLPGVSSVAGVYLMISKHRTIVFADTTVNFHPSAEELAEIAVLAAAKARFFHLEPRVAMLSFSNFGSTRHPDAQRVAAAVDIARRKDPTLIIDGEMQADTAVMDNILMESYPFNRLGARANVLVFPDLASGNIAYKLLNRLSDTVAIGPLLVGLSKPFNVLQRGSDMETVVNVAAVTVVQAQELERSGGTPS